MLCWIATACDTALIWSLTRCVVCSLSDPSVSLTELLLWWMINIVPIMQKNKWHTQQNHKCKIFKVPPHLSSWVSLSLVMLIYYQCRQSHMDVFDSCPTGFIKFKGWQTFKCLMKFDITLLLPLMVIATSLHNLHKTWYHCAACQFFAWLM